MIFERILDIFKGEGKFKTPASAPPDPADEFAHPENQSLFARLKENSRVAAPDRDSPWTPCGYELHAHPDLPQILYDLISDGEVRKGSAYGLPVMANRRGLVFAYAAGDSGSWCARAPPNQGLNKDKSLFRSRVWPKVTSKLQFTLLKAIADRDKIRLFDQATVRQRKRDVLTAVKKLLARSQGRDWTREELYQRGLSR
jgi:hypothetical protein